MKRVSDGVAPPKSGRWTYDLTGRVFGLWAVVGEGPRIGAEQRRTWKTVCACGSEGCVRTGPLTRGKSLSCGCRPTGRIIHGKEGSPEYRAWHSMWSRCTNPANPSFKDYGGRGIKVLIGWETFQAFYADMGDRPSPTHSVDRKNNDGDYCKENCRWATLKEQMNNRRTTRLVTAFGRSQSAAQWAEEFGIRRDTFVARMRKKGWSPEKALTTPIDLRGRKPHA